MAGLLGAGALLLLASALLKLRRPAPAKQALFTARLPGALWWSRSSTVRCAAAAELAVALAVLVVGGRAAAAALAATFSVLAGFSWRMWKVAPREGCGCFGAGAEPVSRWHVGVNLAFVVLGIAAAVHPAEGLLAFALENPAHGAPLTVVTALLAYVSYLTLTALPALNRAIGSVAVPR